MESSPFTVRGAVEGFYGTFYTFPERNDLIRFLGKYGFNFYMYGPKNDRQHRMRWWDPYPPAILGDFAQSIRIAEESGVAFCYAISFGMPLNYASREDFDVITGKFRAFFDRGCRAFGVLLDDLTGEFTHDVNRRHFRSVPQAHADCCNRLYDWARSLDESCSLYLCPSEYFGRAPFSDYLSDLGDHLDSHIEVFYTGPAICSRSITLEDVNCFAEALGRPPLIWDNYPANDLQMRAEMHVGPVHGRDPLLPAGCKGFVANVMNQKEASKIALITLGEYLEHPGRYDPERAWTRALTAVAGADSYDALRHFAENSLASPLQDEAAPEMTALILSALAALQSGERVTTSGAVEALSRYFDTLDESCYQLKNRMRNLALRQNLLPWIEALEDRLWLGRGALRILQAVESGADAGPSLRFTEELLAAIEQNPRRIGSPLLLDLVHYARDRAARTERELTTAGSRTSVSAAELETAPDDPDQPALPNSLDLDLTARCAASSS